MDAEYLAQFLGLYFIIIGFLTMINKKAIMPAIADFMNNRALMLVVALLEVAAGLALIVNNPNITPDVHGAIALVGWIMLAEGVIYLLLPRKEVQRMIKRFNTKFWYVTGGLFAVVFGAYLAVSGFGVIVF